MLAAVLIPVLGLYRVRRMPPPKLAPVALARAVVDALRDGVEDVYPGDVAQEWRERWLDSPKVLERELALGSGA